MSSHVIQMADVDVAESVQAERRNLILECKEVRKPQDGLDHERRALCRERKILSKERERFDSLQLGTEPILGEISSLFSDVRQV